MRIEFDKMEGTGNDFILIDNRQHQIPDSDKAGLAQQYCQRVFGIGADGIVFIEEDPEYDFFWDFYTANGTRTGTCGNGARCAAGFAVKIGAAKESMTFRTLTGPVSAQIMEHGTKVHLPDIVLPSSHDTISLEEDFIPVWSIDNGIPHAVVKVPDPEKVDVAYLGRLLRHHKHFAPAGTNVNFFSILDNGDLLVRTYERGVEDETKACGTGSVAASLIAAQFFEAATPLKVITRGGGELLISFHLQDTFATEIFLEGNTNHVFSGWFVH